MNIPYPSNYFDPFGDEPTHSACDGCGEIHDNGDLTKIGKHYPYKYLCNTCAEEMEKECLE